MNKLRNPSLAAQGRVRIAASAVRSTDLGTVLGGLEWVQRLPDRAQARVLEDCHDKTYLKGESVARMGEPSMFWIGVVDGLLKVSAVTFSGRSVMFTAVPEGSWVGEGSVIKRELRRYDLTAMRATRVIMVPRATFLWLLETDHGFSRYIIDHLNERTGQFLSMLDVSRMTSPVARLAGAICNLFNPVLYPKASSLLTISQEELGELSGLSRSSVNQAIAKLKDFSLISTEYGRVLVLDVDRLREFVRRLDNDEIEGLDP